jgi:trehalose 6-phosphate phosphatase
MPHPVESEELIELLEGGQAGLAADFDGTVSPIVSPPEAAVPLPGVEDALRRLVRRLGVVALVSGRTVADLALRIDVPGALYVGNHGLEWWRCPMEGAQHPTLGRPTHLTAVPTSDESHLLATASASLAGQLNGLAGVRLEDKGLGVAIHYRDAADHQAAREQVLAVCHGLVGQRLQIREGKQVVELVLKRGTDKGTALERIAAEHSLRAFVFLGDDLTDRDGFLACRRLREQGLSAMAIAVLGPETPPSVVEAADATVDGPEAAAGLVSELARAFDLAESAIPT